METKMPTPEQVNEFWQAVSEMGWGRKADHEKIKVALLAKWSPEKAEEMHDTFDALRNPLYAVCDKVVEGLGDDGFSDLLAHIIGLGKEEYERVLLNPQLAAQRANKYDFTESFSYCLPFKQDYQYLTPSHYDARMEKVAGELKKLAADKHTHPKAAKPMRRVAKALAGAVGNPLGLLEHEAQVKADMKIVKEYANYNEWAVLNIMSDMKTYLAPKKAA